MRCVICGKEVEGWGNNAWPVAEGQCCDICDREKVLPARIKGRTDAPHPTAGFGKVQR